MAADNPFEYGRELGPGEIADRETEVAEVAGALLEGAKHFLIGPRRYGKSSVHNVGAHQARKKGALVLRYNVQAFTRMEDLARAIVADTARGSRVPRRGWPGLTAKFFRGAPARGEATIPWTKLVGLLGAAGDRKPGPLLVDALHGLERWPRAKSVPSGLMLDEFQQAVAGGDEARGADPRRRAGARHVGYVFAGSDTRMLAAMTSDPARPLYRLGIGAVSRHVPRPAFAAYMRERFAVMQAKVSEEALTAILDEADDVPYNVQLLAHQCWNALRDRHPRGTHAGGRGHHSSCRGAPARSGLQRAVAGTLGRAAAGAPGRPRAPRRRALLGRATARFSSPRRPMQGAVEGLLEKRVCWRETRSGESASGWRTRCSGCG